MGEELPVQLDSFSELEVKRAIKQLKQRRASGPDDVPAEYWQAVAETEEGIKTIMNLVNKCWHEERVPDEWHTANVSCIFKKGNVQDCDNYRPISLVCVAYKMYAGLLLNRLKAAGAEQRLTPTQFGFRSGRGSTDAIFGVRRHVDLALARKNGRIGMVALDWKKCFDSINVGALLVALGRFGLPAKILRIIGDIYETRRFSVIDGEQSSTQRAQASGVSQGCPLSPFLFVMLMTIVIEDAKRKLSEDGQTKMKNGSLQALLYADDTLLIGLDAADLQQLLDSIAWAGAQYGMELHLSKFQLLEINARYQLHAPDGGIIPAKDTMTYLGASVYGVGSLARELAQKLGASWGVFSKLNRLWKHTALHSAKKIRILHAVVISRLLYGLSSAWLNKAEVRRLNGFYCRCLRVILRIPPAYVSRISNATVLDRACQTELVRQLLRQQLLLYGRLARQMDDNPMRKLTFCAGSLRPATAEHVRRVGRPRNEWAVMVKKEAQKLPGFCQEILYDARAWRSSVDRHCFFRAVQR